MVDQNKARDNLKQDILAPVLKKIIGIGFVFGSLQRHHGINQLKRTLENSNREDTKMKNYQKFASLIGLASLALVMTACNEDYKGSISAKEPLTFTKKKKPVTLPAGVYKAEIKATSKTNLQLEVVLDKKNKLEIDFKADKGTKIIGAGGVINLPASMNKQPYDIVGNQVVDITQGAEVDAVESCTYTELEWRCKHEAVPKECLPDGRCIGGGTREVCGEERVTRYGDQNVSYYNEYTTKDIAIQLLVPNSNNTVAAFDGTYRKTDKIYTYKGICGSRFGHGFGHGHHGDSLIRIP